ncbi:MAG: glycosyltransferase [Candidatus Baldrarchaeia archaeon]
MKDMKEEYPSVSVVIPTYNRREKLIRLLKSIINSNYPKEKMEIVIIDDFSTDGTDEAVRKFIKDNESLKIVYVRHKKPLLIAKSRNDGILIANNDLVFFVDDDNVVDRDCIKSLVKTMLKYPDIGVAGPVTYYFRKPNIIMYAGAVYTKYTRRTKFLYRNVPDNGYLLKNKIINVDGIPNSYVIRKKLAIKVGLIPWRRIPWNGEDGYLQYKIKKLGYRIVIVGDAKVYHDVPLEFREKANEMRLYYALRSKIIFHKDFDPKKQFILFLIFLPFYVIWYVSIALRSKNNKLRKIRAVLEGLIDGLLCREGLKYVS